MFSMVLKDCIYPAQTRWHLYMLLLSTQVNVVVKFGCSSRFHEDNVVFIICLKPPLSVKDTKNGRKLKERISALFKLYIIPCFYINQNDV